MMLTFEEVRRLLEDTLQHRVDHTPKDRQFRTDYLDGVYGLEEDLSVALNKLEAEYTTKDPIRDAVAKAVHKLEIEGNFNDSYLNGVYDLEANIHEELSKLE